MEETLCKHLPEECWESIVSYLDHLQQWEALSLVSKTLLSITNRLRVSLNVINPTIGILSKQLQRFRHLNQIDLSNLTASREHALVEIAESGLDIEVLNISGASNPPIKLLTEFSCSLKNLRAFSCSKSYLNDDDLVLLSDSFPSIEELDISSQHFQHITDRGIVALSTKLKRLRKINLTGNRKISDLSVISLTRNCELLTEIVLRYCFNVTRTGISYVMENSHSCSSLILASNMFHTLDLSNPLNLSKHISTIDLNCIKISDDFLYAIAKADLPLRNFHLTHCENFTLNGIYSLLKAYWSLTSFALDNTNLLTDEFVVLICQFIRKLISVKLDSCFNLTTSSFINIATACPVLSNIEISSLSPGNSGSIKNPSITSVSVQSETLSVILPVCPNLRVLKLNCLSHSHELDIAFILNYCHEIRDLSVNNCTRLRFSAEGDGGICKLETLMIKSSEGMNDRVLEMVSKKCPELVYLNLYRCMSITERGVEEVVEHCARLRYVNLDWCIKVNKEIVARMVASRPSLREIVTPGPVDHTVSEMQGFLQQGCLVRPGTWEEDYY